MNTSTVASDTPSAVTVEIPLNRLVRSPLNVRRDNGAAAAVLAELIHAHGLLQNLVATPEMERKAKGAPKSTGNFGVVAGGRRLEALHLLAEQGRVSADPGVRCLVVSEDEAISISLSENSGREDLNPVDELLAFQALSEAGKTIDAIARAFGISTRRVERRLRLATVAPRFLDLFRQRK